MDELTLQEAAQRLGVSEHTVRRRVKRGTLAGVQVSSPQGFVWRVRLPDAATSPDGLANGQVAFRDALQVIERQQHLIAQLSGQVGFLQGQLETYKALTAPTPHQSAQEGQQGASVAGVVSDDLARPLAAPRKAWWRFW